MIVVVAFWNYYFLALVTVETDVQFTEKLPFSQENDPRNV